MRRESVSFPAPSLMASSGILPARSLLQSLIQLCREVSSMEKLPFVQARNTSAMIRRIKLLSSLFEEIQDTSTTTRRLPPSSILCLNELFSVIQRTKLVIQVCKEGSSLWSLTRTEHISKQFHALVKEMGRALDILPLSLLNITTDIREQVELLHKQAKRAELGNDDRELQRRDELIQLMASNNDKKSKNKQESGVDAAKLKSILSSSSIGLKTRLDYEGEISKLEAEAQRQAGTGGLIAVSNINNLISLVSYAKSIIQPNQAETKEKESAFDLSSSSSSQGGLVVVPPDEFRCPISLDLMRDPVIVSSGHTYDRNSIAQWINSGHHTCPKSGQRLIHMALIPNYALKSLVHQWCQDNNMIPLTHSSPPSTSDLDDNAAVVAIDHISAAKAAMDAVKMTSEFLVGKLATGSLEIQRQAAYELRLLAKTGGMDNRRMIAEAGAIPFLVMLLNSSSSDSRIQENAVTALLNLSIFDNNKLLIVAAGAVDRIIGVLESTEATMEARENAAATIFSLC